MNRCPICDRPVPQDHRGRERIYDRRSCRQRAYERRKAEREATESARRAMGRMDLGSGYPPLLTSSTSTLVIQ